MITDVRQAIVDAILAAFPGYTIYDEDVPQKFKTPSFLIMLINQNYKKRLSEKFRSHVSFDVAFFSAKPTPEIKEDCFSVSEDLFHAFDLIGVYRVLNKEARITDNVLHFLFSIDYSEMRIEENAKMQTQETNPNIKE